MDRGDVERGDARDGAGAKEWGAARFFEDLYQGPVFVDLGLLRPEEFEGAGGRVEGLLFVEARSLRARSEGVLFFQDSALAALQARMGLLFGLAPAKAIRGIMRRIMEKATMGVEDRTGACMFEGSGSRIRGSRGTWAFFSRTHRS